MTNITQVNVTRTLAPTPNALQKTGAFISQGSTTLTPGTRQLLTQRSDLAAILAPAKALTSLALVTGTVTGTTTAPHGFPNGSTQILTVAGVMPDAYNGTFEATITGTSTFTYALSGAPGAVTVQGTVANAELVQMNNSFFAMGDGQAVYVLELGAGTPAAGVTAWIAYEALHPLTIYSNLVPRAWAGEATFVTLCNQYNSTTARKYFHVTMTQGQSPTFTVQMKCVLKFIEAPGADVVEFSAASRFWKTLNYNPGSARRVTPLAFSFLTGVTEYPITPPLEVSFAAANLDYVTNGAEGGISNTILALGVNADGRPFNYWYSIDWVQINTDLNVTNEVINGSNNDLNPLYYNQPGIDRLQGRAVQVGNQAVAFGLALGSVVDVQMTAEEFVQASDRGDFAGLYVVNAIPFGDYTALNPSDYAEGEYDGIMISYAPLRGFKHIVININVTDFVSA